MVKKKTIGKQDCLDMLSTAFLRPLNIFKLECCTYESSELQKLGTMSIGDARVYTYSLILKDKAILHTVWRS